MSNLESSASNAIDKIVASADTLAAKMQELATQYGPDVVDAALTVARVEAGQHLFAGVVLAALSYISYNITRSLATRAVNRRDSFNSSIDKRYDVKDIGDFVEFWIAIPIGVTGATIALISAAKLFNIWNYVGVIEPKLWIARRLLDGVL